MKKYLDYAKNIFSQNGEDGILEELFKDLNITSGLLIEFGAWDGIYLSNTFNLLKNNKNFKGFLIEPDYSKFLELVKIQKKEGNIIISNQLVSFKNDEPNSLDNLIDQYNLQNEKIRLISIDIDSYDYYVTESIKKYLPDVFIIETNSSVGKYEDFISHNGCSLFSLTKLMDEKGYNLVCYCGNGIYVKNELLKEKYHYDDVYLTADEYLEIAKTNQFGKRTNEINFLSNNYIKFIQDIKKEYEEG